MKPTARRNYINGNYSRYKQKSRRLRYSVLFTSVVIILAVAAVLSQMAFSEDAELIDINTAPAYVLETLPGIGGVKAKAIVDYRDAHGPFKTIEDLMKVKGIGAKTLNNIKKLITVSDGKKKMAVVPRRTLRKTTWGTLKRAN